ncbi:helix-turn-helix domain-containing protein [candidate division WOR-3 bacterium]|nr:helix-turn-helix domain-containing protein [candidate division WOR-3 bacterium]
MTLKEASRYLSLHPEVLRKKASLGEIPAKKLGKGEKSSWRFVKADLDRWLSVNKNSNRKGTDENKIIEDLINILKTSDEISKIEDAINSLGIMNIKSAVSEIAKYINSPFEDIRWLSSRALVKMDFGNNRELLYSILLSDKSDKVRIEIASKFAKEGDEYSINYLMETFRKTSDEQEKYNVARRLIMIKPEAIIPFFRTKLHSFNLAIRYRTLCDLRNIGYEGIESDLINMLNERELTIKRKAIEIIGMKKIKDAVPLLQKIIDSENDNEIKKIAAQSIAKIFG